MRIREAGQSGGVGVLVQGAENLGGQGVGRASRGCMGLRGIER